MSKGKVVLSVADQDQQQQQQQQQQQMKSPRRLLIVDDEPLVHKAVRTLLRRELEIVTKLSAEEALRDLGDEIAAGGFDVILLDVLMPGVPDGIDFFRRVQEMSSAPAVIFMTGDIHIANVLGHTTRTAVLAKPFRGQELRDTIARLLSDEGQKSNSNPPERSSRASSVEPLLHRHQAGVL